MKRSLGLAAAPVAWILVLLVTSGKAAWGPLSALVHPLGALLIFWFGVIATIAWLSVSYVRREEAKNKSSQLVS